VRADLPTAPSTIETDYAPAFSPDGQQVAYLPKLANLRAI
jgi:hypothetical protein